MRKLKWICCEPAESDDYACSDCGGDIRGLKCCNRDYCQFENKNEKSPEPSGHYCKEPSCKGDH